MFLVDNRTDIDDERPNRAPEFLHFGMAEELSEGGVAVDVRGRKKNGAFD